MKKQKSKKILSLLLSAIMLVSIIPLAVFAEGNTTEGTKSDKMIMPGTVGISDPGRSCKEGNCCYDPSDYIWFGNNNGKEPIKWRVLDADQANNGSKGMFLLSEYLLTDREIYFDQSNNSNIWQGSEAQTWCSNFASNTSNFSMAEQSNMLATIKTDEEKSLYGEDWGTSVLSGDKVFFLSADELSRYVGNYNDAPGLKATASAGGAAETWGLRSPDVHRDHLVGTVYGGNVGTGSAFAEICARPAFNLNLDSVLFTSAAVNGKKADLGLAAIGDYKGKEWKATLKDGGRSEFTAAKTAKDGDILTVSYENAKTGANEYLSAIIMDKTGAYTHYGKLVQLDGKTNGASGTVQIDLKGIDINDKTLYVFNEHCNGDKQSDYASELCQVDSYSIPADYTAVKEAIAKLPEADRGNYKELTAFDKAVKAVDYTLEITQQEEVNAMADAINAAYNALELKDADYTAVKEAIAKVPEADRGNYKDLTAFDKAVKAVDYTLKITQQEEVNAMADTINAAYNALELKDADYTEVEAAIVTANKLNKDDYADFSKVDEAIAAVDHSKNITEQTDVDAMAKAINDAINGLEKKAVEPAAPTDAEKPANTQNLDIPKTGDAESIVLWTLLGFVSVGGVSLILLKNKKRKSSVR